jgi:hypothetical protein
MSDVKTLFSEAIWRRSSIASTSVTALGRCFANGSFIAIADGTTAEMKVSREVNPSWLSIATSFACVGPMWRSTNAPCSKVKATPPIKFPTI